MRGIAGPVILAVLGVLAVVGAIIYNAVTAPAAMPSGSSQAASPVPTAAGNESGLLPNLETDVKPTGDFFSDLWRWVSGIPFVDIIDFLFSGIFGIVKWFSQGFNIFLNPLVQLAMGPDYMLPWWFGLVVTGILLVLLAITQWENLWNLTYTIVKYILFITGFILAVAIILVFLGAV